MATTTVRTRDKDSLAAFLGWFSVALGAAELTTPKALCRVVGANPAGLAPRVMRLTGARELVQGVGILARPRPTGWLWMRVAGDGLDLSLLGLTAARNRRARTAFAIANVVVVTVPDVLEALQLMRKEGPVKQRMLVRKAVTINKPRQEVEAEWVGAAELRQKIQQHDARVTFADAPGDRGTELAVEFDYAPTAGDLGKAVEKLTGKDLATQLADDLRRFKQRAETGEVVRSDSTPPGHLLAQHLKQRAAQPVEEVAK